MGFEIGAILGETAPFCLMSTNASSPRFSLHASVNDSLVNGVFVLYP